jgi:hypothetical protein
MYLLAYTRMPLVIKSTVKLPVLRKEILHPWNELESRNPSEHRDSG